MGNRALDFGQFLRWNGGAGGIFEGVDAPIIRRAISECLTEKQRKYIVKYYFEGLRIPQIAGQAGVAKSTVSRTIKRGRKRLENALRLAMRG